MSRRAREAGVLETRVSRVESRVYVVDMKMKQSKMIENTVA